jgi:hypothetical protein
MNIIELEDNIKGLPDNSLQNEMVNPTGMFPQYLVMSELQRRQEMRKDYQGRMAAEEKTPPLPSIREQMMAGITQQQPIMQDSGIAGLLPAQPQGAPIPPTMSASPDVMPMYAGGVVRMSGGTQLQDLYGLTTEELKLAGLYDDPNTEEDERITSYEQDIIDYYKTLQEEQPKKIAEEKRFGEGLNLMKAGLALGTAGTFKELSAGLEKTIDSIDASNKAISKKEDDLKKSKLEKAKSMAAIEAKRTDRLADLSKLKTEKQAKQALADYYKSMDPKTKLSGPGQIAKEILDGVYGPPESLNIYRTTDEKGNKLPKPIIDSNKLLELAASKVPSIASADIRTLGSKQEELAKLVTEQMSKFSTIQEVINLAKEENISEQDAYDRIKIKKEFELRQQLGLGSGAGMYSGGVVGKSSQSFNDVVKTINA